MTTTPLRPAFVGIPLSAFSQPPQAAVAPSALMASTAELAKCLEALQREADQVQRVGRAQLAGVLALLPTDAAQHLALKLNGTEATPAAEMRDARIDLVQALNHARELLRDPVLYQFERIMELVDHEIDHARGIVSGMTQRGGPCDAFDVADTATAAALPQHDSELEPPTGGGALQAVCALLRSTTARAGELEQEGGIKAVACEELCRLLGLAITQLEHLAPTSASASGKSGPVQAASRRGTAAQRQAA